MRDYISRQDAIDALAKAVPYAICDESTESYTNGLTDAYNLICQLPSVQTERKTGKWDDIGGIIRWGCPICHYAYETKYNFCPNCGADMRGEEDE